MRTFTAEDAPEIFRCITPSLTRFMAWEPPPSIDAFAEVWRHWLSAMECGEELYFVVRLGRAPGRETLLPMSMEYGYSEYLGLVGLHDIGSRRPELGLWIKEAAQRRGFGREALGLVTSWASTTLVPESFIYPVFPSLRPPHGNGFQGPILFDAFYSLFVLLAVHSPVDEYIFWCRKIAGTPFVPFQRACSVVSYCEGR
ncbi:MAG TPA: GNAT family N-acetyltransferase [Dongiaceae bacterium]|nr:GNAT family N-acetyltransferase [Dongiaceae bacterium]